MPALMPRCALVVLGLALTGTSTLVAQEPAGEDVVKMEAFNVTAYHGKIPIIDGFTGNDYEGANEVVFSFAKSFNKLLLGYHKKLVTDEIKHMQFRIKLGKDLIGKWRNSPPRSGSAPSRWMSRLGCDANAPSFHGSSKSPFSKSNLWSLGIWIV